MSVRDSVAIVVGIIFIIIGVDHFIRTEWYNPIVPSILGFPAFWVYASGIAEIGFGIAIILKTYRKKAAVFGILMLVALYWANLNMWLNDIPLNDVQYSTGWHIGRLIVQGCLILLLAWVGELQFRSKGIDHVNNL